MTARQALERHGPGFVVRRGVVAVSVGSKIVGGIDTGAACVTVWVARKLRPDELAPSETLPESVAPGNAAAQVPVDVVESSRITGPPPVHVPLVSMLVPGLNVADLRSYARPVQGGLSAANWRFSCGTVTTTATDAVYPGIVYALSCNHVLAGLNRFPLGDPMLQPAPVDGGTWPATVAGQLARFVPMRFDGTPNPVDAAVAYLPDGGTPGSVAWLGPVSAVRAAAGLEVGESVRKVGRSTGLSEARIVGVDALVWVDYSETGLGGRALLAHQVITTPCAAYGDSGSLLLDSESRGVGVLCAGSTVSTVFSSLEHVQTELDIVVANRLE